MVLIEQTELSRRMIDFAPYLNGYFSTVSLQFGYMVFFGVYFPLGLFCLLIANIVMVSVTAFAYSHHVKRALAEKSAGIGVWKQILSLISYCGVIYNGLVLIFPGSGLIPLFGSENNTRDLILILMLEHLLLGFKALIRRLIAGIPDWVKNRTIKENYLEERHQEKIIINYKNIKHMKKQAELFGEVEDFGRRAANKVGPAGKVVGARIQGIVELEDTRNKNGPHFKDKQIKRIPGDDAIEDEVHHRLLNQDDIELGIH